MSPSTWFTNSVAADTDGAALVPGQVALYDPVNLCAALAGALLGAALGA